MCECSISIVLGSSCIYNLSTTMAEQYIHSLHLNSSSIVYVQIYSKHQANPHQSSDKGIRSREEKNATKQKEMARHHFTPIPADAVASVSSPSS